MSFRALEGRYVETVYVDLTYPSLAAYLAAARKLPSFQPWNRYLEIGLADLLEELPDGRARSRTPRHVAEEEIASQRATSLRALHGRIAAPTLILRAESGLAPGLPPVLTAGETAAITRAMPRARLVEIPANHYTIAMNGRADVGGEIGAFLEDTGSRVVASGGAAVQRGETSGEDDR